MNGAYANQRGGKLRISVGGALGGNGGGVNQNAVTIVRDIFTITNHGSQSVGVWLTDEAKAVTFKGGLILSVVTIYHHIRRQSTL